MKIVTAILALLGTLLFATTANAHPATGIVVDRAGNVYFSDLETIWRIDAKGKKTVFRAGVSGRHVHELAIDDEGNIYGADVSYEPARKSWPSAIWKMTPAGKLTYLLEPTEDPPRGMSIWRDRVGNMYLVDQNNHTKAQTLLLRRDPSGKVSTLAGSAYGHRDGTGAEAHFGSVGGMTFGPDGSLYLADGYSVRKVSMAGVVTTVAKDLNFKTNEDQPGEGHGSLTGLSVDQIGNVFVADAGKRRLLKITSGGKVEVVYRSEAPFFPNGVFATPAGEVFVMEVSTLPGGPRIRKLANGKNEVLTGGLEAPSAVNQTPATQVGASTQTVIAFFYPGRAIRNIILLVTAGLIVSSLVVWKRRRRERRT